MRPQYRIIRPPRDFLEASEQVGISRPTAAGLYVRLHDYAARKGIRHLSLRDPVLMPLFHNLSLPPGWMRLMTDIWFEEIKTKSEDGVSLQCCRIATADMTPPSRLRHFLSSRGVYDEKQITVVYTGLMLTAIVTANTCARVEVPLDIRVAVAAGCVVHIVCRIVFFKKPGLLPVLENVLS